LKDGLRRRDLADGQELIRDLALPVDIANRLNPSVREKFVELCNGVHDDCIEP
jgi:hypothetical protein